MMQEFHGKTAFVTGAASGIGLGMAKAFVGAGMKVAITDVRKGALETALASFGGAAANVRAIGLDVTDRAAWVRAADEAEGAFGPVHVLCNNAGVNIAGKMQDATYADWDFCLGVNLGGVINGVHTFVRRMLAHGEGGHIVNTSSMGGLSASVGAGLYCTSKYAVVGLSESLRADLMDQGIGVSVYCPSAVQSELFESTAEVRPEALADSGAAPPPAPDFASRAASPIFATAMTAEEAGLRVLNGIRRNDMYILTHPEIRRMLETRARAITAALPDEPPNQARIAAMGESRHIRLYEEQIAKPPPTAP
jgi:NADP-dependent 3-hydroxy acid dehydrogenase YdfG